jgi:hypothetical protein
MDYMHTKTLLIVSTVLLAGCSGSPTAPTTERAGSSGSALTGPAASAQANEAAQASAANVNITDLREHGWTCVPTPIPGKTICSHPHQGLPVFGNPPPDDRPATYSFFVFDGSGTFIGTEILIRTNLYHGQLCESSGQPYVFRPPIGYYECVHTVGN